MPGVPYVPIPRESKLASQISDTAIAYKGWDLDKALFAIDSVLGRYIKKHHLTQALADRFSRGVEQLLQ